MYVSHQSSQVLDRTIYLEKRIMSTSKLASVKAYVRPFDALKRTGPGKVWLEIKGGMHFGRKLFHQLAKGNRLITTFSTTTSGWICKACVSIYYIIRAKGISLNPYLSSVSH
jgi:hypothetical protein